jgi:hypothetical protein
MAVLRLKAPLTISLSPTDNGMNAVLFLRIAPWRRGRQTARETVGPSTLRHRREECMCARRTALTIGSLLALTLGGAGALGAQSSAAAAWQATPASVLKGALRSVAAAQERFRAANGRYATSLDPLGVRPESGVRVDILGASARGWQARATHQAQPGRSCVVFVGSLESVEPPRTDGDHEMAGEEGIPLCDRMR